jgi:Ca2+-binding EF-hand superfamily protein
MKRVSRVLWAMSAALSVSAGVALAQLAPEQLQVAEANFKKADAAGTGKLTADEFKAFIDFNADAKIGKAAKIKSYGAYGKAFAAVDTDKDGTITWEEYVSAQKN